MATKNLAVLHDRYVAFERAHPNAAEDFIEAIESVLSDAGLTYDRVSARMKQWRSLRTKASKRTPSGELVYPHPWEDIHDLIGVRITTLHSTEIPEIIEALRDQFIVIRSVDKAAQTRIAGDFGYGSHHLILEVDDRVEELASYQGFQFEVQIRTVLQHAWAEFEHDIRYKRSGQKLDPRVDRAFTLAAGLIELADQQFDQIAAIQEPDGSPNLDVELTAKTLPGIIAMIVGTRFPQSRTADYSFLDELLDAHGVETVSQLRELLRPSAIDEVTAKMKYRFKPGQIRIIDDLLLNRFGEEHIAKTGELGSRAAQRAGKLRHRLEALREGKESGGAGRA